MPPADVAVRLAKALNVTVEYLVTGEQNKLLENHKASLPKIQQELDKCSEETRHFLETAVHLFAMNEK